MPSFKACCSHSHDCEAADCGPAYSLYKNITLDKVRCLNEEMPGSCKNIFRPWSERTKPLDSPLSSPDDDDELLLHIPFDGCVKLKAISIIGGSNGNTPAHLKVFTNRENLDFTDAKAMAPQQEWDLTDDTAGVMEYPTMIAKFSGVHCITMLLTGTHGGDRNEIHFIGLKGEHEQRRREAVIAVYETRPNISDHKVPGANEAQQWKF
mmetsp:Transcript_7334/g.14457  ORF Transcript_7334/g.14457 Transcript_7334/m.14457 type:complete len:208 (+) Transcript_7334:73-696(+)